ncbi:MAG: hypothetical protein KAU48_11865 [Candidatus Thorarchaeota archaeon]|nr:hypothetical protein [Candidatus Thorarchaeota archaeon]
MISNKIGFAAVVFCVLLFTQVSSSPSVSMNTSNSISLVSSETLELTSFGNIIPESSLSAIECEIVVSAPQVLGTVAIVVENSLYSSITAAVTQYRQDLNDTGYHTILYNSSISTAEELKANLSSWYDSEDLVGAVLIGRLPYAQYHHGTENGWSPETFICDLFLTDLDGTWSDTNPSDGIYDSHSSTTGTDIFPEIFLGRIDPTCLTWGTSVSDHINTYLARIHDYRTGGVTRNHRALFYIDDDWIPWAPSWSSDAAPAYSTRTLVDSPGTTTNASDWLNTRVTQDYQWGHLAAHSSPTTHYFGPGGSGEGTVTSAQIRAAPPSFNFYNLFCCSGAKWTIADDLGVTYTFSGSYSLASIGSSKTGSMLDNDEFYGPLGQNATLGESLRDWFSESLTPNGEAGSAYLEWYYGMNIIGDPLLSIYYDTTVQTPTINSESHPDSAIWYNNPRPQINWSVPPEVNEIAGYYYILDQNPTTIPVQSTGTYTTTNSTLATEDIASGTWYYHVVAVDSVGNVGEEAAHFSVNIDVTSPEIALIYPSSNGYDSNSTLTATWTFQDDHSSHGRTIVWIDSSSNIVHNGSALECVISGLTEGFHVINVTTYDEVMNRVSLESTFNIDLTNPVLSVTSPIDGDSIGTHITIEWDVSDTGSGYQLSVIYLDGSLIGITYAPNSTFVVSDLSYGEHVFNITVYDWVNNTASEEIVVSVLQQLPDPLILLSASAIIGLIIGIGVVYRRRR